MIEHGSSRAGRFLGGRRFRFALWIAVAEGVLVVVDVIPWWLVFVAALVTVAAYVSARDNRSETIRQATWIAAVSQVLVALVPVLMLVVTAVAVFALVLFALVALVLLLVDRR